MTLLILDVECPRCGSQPNLRVLEYLVELVQDVDPDRVIATWGCQRKGCPEKVLITAGMIQRASHRGRR